MNILSATERNAAVLWVLALAAAISFAGCASYSRTVVPPGDAVKVLRVGDEVEVTRKDSTTAYFKVEKITETEVSGSLLTNMFGPNVSISFTEISSITLYAKDGRDAEQTAEIIGGIMGLALFLSLL